MVLDASFIFPIVRTHLFPRFWCCVGPAVMCSG